MKHLIKYPVGPFQFIAFTGEMKHFGQTLAEAAASDPQLEQQVLSAVNEILVNQMSRDIGVKMIDVILNPQCN